MFKHIVVDLECNGLMPEVSKIWIISVMCTETMSVKSFYGPSLEEGLRVLQSAESLIMHNGISFDLPVIQKVHGISLDPLKVKDTLVLSKLGNPDRGGGHSLKSWGFRLSGFPKVEIAAEMWDRWHDEFIPRCETDVKLTYGVYERLKGMYDVMPKAVEIEHKVAIACAKMHDKGFQLDQEYCLDLLADLREENERIKDELEKVFPARFVQAGKERVFKVAPNRKHWAWQKGVTGTAYTPIKLEYINPNSRQQLASRLIKLGWKPTQFTNTGQPILNEETIVSLKHPSARVLAKYLKNEKLIGQINAQPQANGRGGGWLHHVGEDGRVRASIDPCRAVTGRPACSSPNLQQVARDPRMRRAWKAKQGSVLVGIDASGLELRCLNHYLRRYDEAGEYQDELLNGDIHAHTQTLLGLRTRDGAKTFTYAWLYGAGNAKLGRIWIADHGGPSESPFAELGLDCGGNKRAPSATKVGLTLRERMATGIVGLKEVLEGVAEKAEGNGRLRGLDGRSLWVRSPHSALNLLLQSAGIIVIKAWIAEMYDEGMMDHAVMWVHDEIQFEVKPEEAVVFGRAAIELLQHAGRKVGFRTPLDGEAKVGTNWSETH